LKYHNSKKIIDTVSYCPRHTEVSTSIASWYDVGQRHDQRDYYVSLAVGIHIKSEMYYVC